MMETSKTNAGKVRLIRTVGGASLASLLIVSVAGFEGKRNDPYRDLIGRATVCYGETRVQMRHYTDAECSDMLAGSLSKYADGVKSVNPTLSGPQLVAATSLSYNIGLSAYQRSTVAREFNAGHTRKACDAFLRFSYAGGRQVAGLLKRRQQEREICLRGVK